MKSIIIKVFEVIMIPTIRHEQNYPEIHNGKDYENAIAGLAKALIINDDNPITTNVINVSVIDNGVMHPWLNINYHDKELMLFNFKDMRKLWTTLKDVSEKAEALYTDYKALIAEEEKY